MKKSELKALLKVIVQEVIEAKKQKLTESKGLSGFKKTSDKKENTQMGKDDKNITSTDTPKEKEEGKKLPVVKKPATPQKVGSLKEDIVSMIREALDAHRVEEMARVAGAIGSKYKVQDPSSPTGWVVKGHKTIPDGTPTDAPKGPYVPKGMVGMGRPKKATVAGGVSSGEADEQVGPTLDVTVNGELQDFDFLNNTWPRTKAWIEANVMPELGDAALTAKIGQSVYDKIEAAKELDIDNKLNRSNNKIELFYNKATNTLDAK